MDKAHVDYTNLPCIAITSGLVGLGLILWGIVLWRPVQKVQDELERARLADAVSKITPAERRAAAIQDAAEDLAYSGSVDTADLRVDEHYYAELESRVSGIFKLAFGSTHSVESEVKLTKRGVPVAYVDILLTARDPKATSYVVEIKAARQTLSDQRVNAVLVRTGRSAIVAASLLGRKVRGIVFIVLTKNNLGEEMTWEGWPVEDGDPRNQAGTFVVSEDLIARWERSPDGLRRFIEA
ncbi:MAG: hypothetical protein ABL886_06155 [Rhodoglobus sp.]